MVSEIPNVEIGASTIHVSDGNYSSKYPKSHEFLDSGIPFVSANNLRDGRIIRDNLKFISEAQHAALKKGHVRTGDVLLVTRGSLGLTALVTSEFDDVNINAQLVLLRADNVTVDARYLFFVANSPDFQSQVIRSASGTAQPQLPIGPLKRLTIPLPPISIQRRIAGILSAYDELIENSQRRIRILESMARALYREWFVHFRFPGHESVPRIPSPLGEIPKGWEGRFGDLATIERDGINPFEFPEEAFEHFSIPAFDNGRQPAIELGATILSGKYCIDDSTVLLSKLNPRIPRIWLPVPSGQRRAITSTEFLALKPQPGVTREFIYAKCCSDEFVGQFGSLAIGTSTSHQRVKPENLLAMRSSVPDRKTIARFTKLVSPMLTVCQQLRSQTQNLRRTRDLLLPRLLSGQIDVEAMPS